MGQQPVLSSEDAQRVISSVGDQETNLLCRSRKEQMMSNQDQAAIKNSEYTENLAKSPNMSVAYKARDNRSAGGRKSASGMSPFTHQNGIPMKMQASNTISGHAKVKSAERAPDSNKVKFVAEVARGSGAGQTVVQPPAILSSDSKHQTNGGNSHGQAGFNGSMKTL